MQRRLKQRGLEAIVVLGAMLGAWTSAEAQRLTWLGIFTFRSDAYGVSADGTVVVGSSNGIAFRWTPRGGMQSLGTLGGTDSNALAVSADGSVVVGRAMNASGQDRAFRWTAQGGMQDLGVLPNGLHSGAYDVSWDGSTIVGWGFVTAALRFRAFRWTPEEGMIDLADFGIAFGQARAVSADGRVIVGTWNGSAFRWVEGQEPQELGTLGGSGSLAFDVSADGNTVVGRALNPSNRPRAFRWTAAEGMQDLGTLGGSQSEARGVSADGSIVVGHSELPNGLWAAFRWVAGRGMERLDEVYARLLPAGSSLGFAYAVSPDGRYIVGTGFNRVAQRSEAFLLDTWRTGDTNGDGCVNDVDLLRALFAFGTPGTGYTRHEDINKDGIVDDADLLVVLFNFGGGC